MKMILPARLAHVLVLALAGVAAPLLRAESILALADGLAGDRVHILTVAQVGSEVHYTSTVEQSAGNDSAAAAVLSTVLDLDCPALVLKQVAAIDFAASDVRVLYSQGKVVAAYDPALAQKWVATAQFGWVWLPHYPWFYSAKEAAWLYTLGGEIVDGDASTPSVGYWIFSRKTDEWTFVQ